MRNTKMTLFLLMLPFFIITLVNTNPLQAQGWTAFRGTPDGGGDDYKIQDVTEFYNGISYSLMTSTQSHRGFIYPVYNDYLGEGSDNTQLYSEDTYYSKALAIVSNDTLLILNEKEVGNGNQNLVISKYTATSDAENDIYPGILWEEAITLSDDIDYRGTKIHPTDDGNFIVLGGVINGEDIFTNEDILLMKISPTAQVLWTQIYETDINDMGAEVVQTSDGGFLILKNTVLQFDPGFQLQTSVLKVDALGNIVGETNLAEDSSSNERGMDISTTSDGNCVITGTKPGNGGDVFLIKISEEGNLLWRQNYSMPDLIINGNAVEEDEQGDLVIAGYVYDSEVFNFDFYLLKTDAAGALIFGKKIEATTFGERAFHLSITPDGGYLLAGSTFFFEGEIGRWVKTGINGYVKPCEIWGNVYHDLNEDCVQNDGDVDLKQWMIRAFQDSTTIYYGTTDDFGNYQIPVDTGDYIVSILYPNNYWTSCYNDSIIHLNYLDTIQIDFPVQTAVECPLLLVDIGSVGVFRPCQEASYIINYCNYGPVTAMDAYVEITLDPLLDYNSSDISPSFIEGNVYTFPLGDITSGDCGNFQIQVTPSCDSTDLGITLCTDAHIYPDSICSPEFVNWEGAFIELDAHCDGENLIFSIKNIGNAATVMPLQYIVIEDAILLMQDNFEIESGGMRDVIVPANGSTYHLYAQQEPGAPSFYQPVIVVEGCGLNDDGDFSVGFVNQFPLDNTDSFLSSLCIELVNSYDPNDKKALPTGYGEDNTIWQNVDLSYQIRFQNTGTAPALNVVIIDTLSSFLDVMTIQPGASSHSYSYRVESSADVSEAIVTFTFDDIQLVDSLTNEPASHGFINFKIAQKRDNPITSVIENEAAIYFDFNPPIITNTTWHTVGEHFIDIVLGSTQTFIPNVKIKAWPNPFSENLTIELSNMPATTPVFLKLYDINGRVMKKLNFEDGKVEISRQGLSTGIYLFQILSEGKLMGSGKVIVN